MVLVNVVLTVVELVCVSVVVVETLWVVVEVTVEVAVVVCVVVAVVVHVVAVVIEKPKYSGLVVGETGTATHVVEGGIIIDTITGRTNRAAVGPSYCNGAVVVDGTFIFNAVAK